jgi:hypothetical protein
MMGRIQAMRRWAERTIRASLSPASQGQPRWIEAPSLGESACRCEADAVGVVLRPDSAGDLVWPALTTLRALTDLLHPTLSPALERSLRDDADTLEMLLAQGVGHQPPIPRGAFGDAWPEGEPSWPRCP